MKDSVIQKAAKGLSILFVMKIFSRVIDFVLNILVIQEVEPTIYGLTIHYMILTNIVLFYTKMCLKNSYQKRGQKANQSEIVQSAKNMMIFGIGFTIFIGIICGAVWYYWYNNLNEHFTQGLACYILACIIESMCEPLLSKFVLNFNYSVGAKSEAIAVFTKTLFLFFLTKVNIFHTLVNFGLSQIFYASMMLLCCLFFGGYQSLIPSKVEGKDYYITPEMLDMGYQFTVVSVIKLISQELEKIVLINVKKDDVKLQSEYLLVSNIGSLVPRYVYAPIEEINFNLFAKLSQKSNKHKSEKEDDNKDEKQSLVENKNVAKSKQENEVSKTQETQIEEKKQLHSEQLDQARDILSKVVKIVNIIGCLAIFFGIPYAKAFLTFLYGSLWNYPACVLALQAYCVYEWVMGINGITEAFVQGTIEKSELQTYRNAIYSSTFFYIISCYFLVEYGSAGIILSCILSMVSRISVSFFYIYRKIFNSQMSQLSQFVIASLPNKIFFIGCVLSLFVGYYTTQILFPHKPLLQLLIGGGNAGVLLLYLLKVQGREFRQLFGKEN
ncbi:RFT1-like protein (macronuclear) [Tetrahymena thermophila SB210]|uniref:Protein RFT1 homolog n=1 Tax=Tetrahymena thermophila (strain SB210) TaxID=312017 RepID=Q22BM5_TETTS|nr:RFT1-like protein [Tetrahymena thermophila SB210]EAR82704.2 RFT1-like protein [Tetrahymena thermophila SB210]|eukprot:XP_001030367.2 RFT1-like protein [Tetrahymena thermophila SB210]